LFFSLDLLLSATNLPVFKARQNAIATMQIKLISLVMIQVWERTP